MRKIRFFLICFLLIAAYLPASCYEPVVTEQQAPLVQCLYKKWKEEPTRKNLKELLHPLFYVYLSDGNNAALHAFFDELRRDGSSLTELESLKRDLVHRYTFKTEPIEETAALWAMQPADARAIFLLFQTDPEALSDEISRAMQRAVYDQIRDAFFKSALHRQFGYFPPSEYLRLQEILKRLSWSQDPYLKNLNRYFQALVLMNLGKENEGRTLMLKARQGLEESLMNAKQKLAQKRILSSLADVDLVLGNHTDAEQDYLWILRIDPQDWNALLNLSYLLNDQKKCSDGSVWVEATIRSDQEFFDIVLHCGSQELPVPDAETESPIVASLLFPAVSNGGLSRQR